MRDGLREQRKATSVLTVIKLKRKICCIGLTDSSSRIEALNITDLAGDAMRSVLAITIA